MVNYPLSIDDLSGEERIAVTRLKQRMIGYMDQELYEDLSIFVRFLRARDLNINAAETMLKNYLEWRKLMQIDTILTDYTSKEVVEKYITFDYIGIDKEGSPIMYFHAGCIDSRGVLKSCRKIDVKKGIVQRLESVAIVLKQQSIKLGRHIDKWTMILNFENLSFAVVTHKETLTILGILLEMYEANYPERLKVAYCINASLYFTMAFSVAKHFLSGPTLRKLRIFGKEGWKDDILRLIDPEVLPAFLGGNRTDPDGNPLCLTFINRGGIVPESYYIKKNENSIVNLPDVKKLTVTRLSKAQLKVNVTNPGYHIEWEFETKSRDIGFSLLYKKDNFDAKVREEIPKTRIDTCLCAETGMFKCEKAGIYIIEFDNTYSWIFQKEIYYRVSVVSPSVLQT